MTVVKSFDLEGNKQSYANWISNLSPCDSPFTSMIGKDTIDQAQYSWQTDTLAPPQIDAFREGSDCEFPKRAVTNELTNFTSILRKVINISDTVGAVGTHGRNSEIAYQMKKASKELMRDLEFMNLNNKNGNPGVGDLASKFFGYEGLCAPYGAVDPDTGAIVHQVADVYNSKAPWFTIDAIYDVTTNLYISGSKADKIMFHPRHANVFSGLLGDCKETPLVHRMFEDMDTRFNAKVSKIRDPLGRWYTLIPNRFMPEDKVFIFSEDDWTQTILRQPKSVKIGKKGSSEQYMVEMEVGLRHRHHFASGILSLVPGLLLRTHVVPKHIKPNEQASVVCTVTDEGSPVVGKRVAWFCHDIDAVRFDHATSTTNAGGVATTTFEGLKVGTYDVYGTVDGQLSNMATVVISNEGPIAAKVELIVHPTSFELGELAELSSRVTDSLGHHMAGVEVTWHSTGGEAIIESFTNAEGVATSFYLAAAVGDFYIYSSCEGISSTAQRVTVVPAPATVVRTVIVSLDKDEYSSGDTITITVEPKNGDGDSLAGKVVSFEIDPDQGITVPSPVTTNASGIATATVVMSGNSVRDIVAICDNVRSSEVQLSPKP